MGSQSQTRLSNFHFLFFFQSTLIAQLVKNLPAMQETPVQFQVRKICWRRDRLPSPVFLGFPVAQLVKNPPAMWETWVRSLGWEDPLEKGKATHSSILAWRSPWGHKESDMTEQPSFLMKIKFYKIHFDDNKKRSTVQKKRKLIFSSLPPGTCIEFIQFQIFKA